MAGDDFVFFIRQSDDQKASAMNRVSVKMERTKEEYTVYM